VRRAGGLLLGGALSRVGVAVIASGGLWAGVMWAVLTHPVPPRPPAPPMPLPPAVRLLVASGRATPIGGTFDRFDVESQPVVAPVNGKGDVAFFATVLRNKATEGIFLASGSRISKIVAVGDGVPGGGLITDFTRHPAPSLNDSGTVAFDAAISSAQSAEGIFMAKDGDVVTIAEVGGDAPGVVSGTFVAFDTPSVNNRDEVVFVASVRHLRELHEVVYLYSNGHLRKLLEERDPYLGGGFFQDFGVPAINNRGVVAVPVTLDHGPVTGGIFVAGTRDLKMLVGAGQTVPDGRMIVQFSERIAIDDDDNIAFGAHIGVAENQTEAVLRVNTTGVTLIAAVGDAAPQGGRFAGFGAWPSAGPAGRIVFVAALEHGPGPIGIYASRAGNMTRLVLAGEKLPGGSQVPPFALNPMVTAGNNGGVSFLTSVDGDAGGGSRLYYYGPPPR